MIWWLFLFLFAISEIGSRSLYPENIHWLIIHYHKTGFSTLSCSLEMLLSSYLSSPTCEFAVIGHDLTRAIFEPLSYQLSLSFADNKGPRRELWDVDQYEPKRPYFQANINVQGGADLHYNWNEHHPPEFKVVHFVRDPIDYIVSAYLYHAQLPPPPEKFVRQRRYNPCVYSQAKLDLFVQELVLFGQDGNFIRKSLNDTIKLCKDLHKHGPLHQELRHLALQSTDEIGALQLEAARSIIADEIDAGGDILRMVANSLREKEAGRERAKRVFLADFPFDNASKWLDTMTSVFEFLMDADTNTLENVDKKKRIEKRRLQNAKLFPNVSSIVDFVFKKAFITNTSDNNVIQNAIQNSGVHVTSSLISREKRLGYMKAIENDRVIGPLLHLFREILDDK